MMENYTFRETSSRNVTDQQGEQLRQVDFRGTDRQEGSRDFEELNVDGRILMPVMDYFMAGMESRLPEIIKEKVVEKLTERSDEPEQPDAE